MSTKIEWAANHDGTPGETWNPIVGCQILSPGCKRCYAMRTAYRLGKNPATPIYHGLTHLVNDRPVWTGVVRLNEKALLEPLRRRKPTTYFVNSMSDLFADGVERAWIDRIWAVMALSPQHTFIVLTKRPERQRAYSNDPGTPGRVARAVLDLLLAGEVKAVDRWPVKSIGGTPDDPEDVTVTWPLANVWLGTSAERQPEWDARVPHLLRTCAARRLVSVEPLLGPIDPTVIDLDGHYELYPLTGSTNCEDEDGESAPDVPGLDWVILGGESGPDSRPMHPDWARRIRDDCAAAGVAFFFKQWGAWTPGVNVERQSGLVETAKLFDDRWHFSDEDLSRNYGHIDDEPDLYGVGKKAAGRLLDGREHNERPPFTHVEGRLGV